jgi:hypothetical protein
MIKSVTTFMLFVTSFSLWAQESPKYGKTPTPKTVKVIIDAPLENVRKEFADVAAIFLRHLSKT